ncbi:Delta(1)-pyrroline-2-carboxylate/Delta(1)-piperideine-2-carboxylate reductase [Carnimonas sp. R-84981]|uniref:Ldh family oxidoreductase n=1 Tax=Carnimonas bestiolae TaxID=3402172 RepID=UPI003EDC7F35
MNAAITLPIDEAQALAERLLKRQGFAEPHAQAIARTVVAGQRDECFSHGLYRLLGCVHTLKAGKVSPSAQPDLHDQSPAIVRVDAGGAFSQLAYELGRPVLVEKARSQGIAGLAINHCVHFSALWIEIEALTQAGLVAFACTPSHAWVAPAGGTSPLLGTNPMAFGWPRGDDTPPYLFDFATSAIARGDIELARREGRAVPEEWGIDGEGNPTSDPATILDEGAMQPFGGHKGSALATMVELLAGPLIGDLTSHESMAFDDGAGGLPYHGEIILAFDPKRWLGDGYQASMQRAEGLFERMAAQGARLPSQRRYQARKRSLANGLRVAKPLYDELLALANGNA